jgi:putative ABC transport system ATP-binding protein
MLEQSVRVQSVHAQNVRLIDLREVVKTYETGAGAFTALKGIDLQVDGGEFVAVVGKSGSGKSTLLNMLAGIDRPTSGQIVVDGTPVHTLREGQIAAWRGRNVGVVFQFFQLLPTLTAVENVMLPMDFCHMYPARQRRIHAMSLLDLVDVSDQANKLPAALSGGQQQRVAIARALVNEPSLVLADEPTGNLDTKSGEEIMGLLHELHQQGATIVMVTHSPTDAAEAKRIITLRDGEVVSRDLDATAAARPDSVAFTAGGALFGSPGIGGQQ